MEEARRKEAEAKEIIIKVKRPRGRPRKNPII